MYFRPLLWILFLFISLTEVLLQEYEDDYGYEFDAYEEPKPENCSTAERIRHGHVTYSEWGLPGSVLTFHCGPGLYPHPVSYRVCGSDGQWSPMRADHRLVLQATCKNVMCPAQLQLDHGDFWPRDQWFRVGATQSFSCHEGFTLSGSAQRNCTISGKWTGTTPICDNHAEDCDDPGIPPGAQRTASQFHFGEKVTYMCHVGLDLLGSSERVCLESREWSGSPPRCLGTNTYDSPSDVAAAMSGSLAGVMDVFSPESKREAETDSYGRSINVAEGSRLNIYILLDTSGSIKKTHFDTSRDATIALIRKLDSYEVQIKYHILSFASESVDIVDIRDSALSGNAADVIHSLMEFNYNSHGNKTGTNLFAALQRVNEMISFFKANHATNHFNETQNIIIIETDGYSNTGKNPIVALQNIRGVLGYLNSPEEHAQETLLDVYAFGIGDNVKKEQLNALASKKPGESHVFILQSFKALGEVFNSIISDKSVAMCGVAQEDHSKNYPVYNKPWHVIVSSAKMVEGGSFSCFGSIVSENWVLTAAHCFAKASAENVPQNVDIHYGFPKESVTFSKKVILHPGYNTKALRHRNVSEFYDYDVALVQLNQSIPLSWVARPICLPCTVPASRALKSANLTCQQHRKELLAHQETAAFFIRGKQNPTRKETLIQTQSQRRSCVENAMKTLTEPTDVTVEEYVTDRFLCSRGSSGYPDAFSCKGDSGGSLFLQKKKRYFQVGVLSWGITDVCKQSVNRSVPPHARDFHIDLFEILPWLKQHLGKDVQFLPEIP